MKKLYKQPQTDFVQTALQTLICTSIVGGGETPDSGMRGDAPTRRGNPVAVMYI